MAEAAGSPPGSSSPSPPPPARRPQSPSSTETPLPSGPEGTLRLARAVLARPPAGLFLDIDGTISPIAPTAALATVSPVIRDALSALTGRLAVVAAVTGRQVEDGRRLVGVDGLVYVGNHGLEWWEAGAARLSPAGVAWRDEVARAVEVLMASRNGPGLRFEYKGATAAIHYRQASDPAAARAAILGALSSLPQLGELVVSEGRRVVNLLPPVGPNKGSAVTELVREHRLRGAVYFGDDTTDLDAFLALGRLRQAGTCRGLSVAVLSPEVPPELVAAADATVASVAEVEQVLVGLAADQPAASR